MITIAAVRSRRSEHRKVDAAEPSRRLVDRRDAAAAIVAVTLVALAAVIGGLLYLNGRPVQASAAPFYAHWLPHVGPGTPLVVAVAALVVWRGFTVAERLSWRALVGTAYVAAVVWTLSLALVDGWQRGVAGRLTTAPEYLHEVPGVTDVSQMLGGFTGRILAFQPDSWTTHVAGHPPGAFLIFVWLERLGLGGGAWAAVVCVLIGSLAAVAVPETVRLLSASGEAAARAVVPFAVVFPGAVWVGVSADGMFAGVTAVGVMLLARKRAMAAVAGGALVTFGAYLSYGLVLLAPLVLVATLAGRKARSQPAAGGQNAARRNSARAGAAQAGGTWADIARAGGARAGGARADTARANGVARRTAGGVAASRRGSSTAAITTVVGGALAGGVAVVAAFSMAGFWWLDGYHLVVERYYQGLASIRPYGYWVWANVAALVACAGPTAAVILRRAVAYVSLDATRLLPLAAAAAILAADLSGLSKAETERIWLPFAVWFAAGAALLPVPGRRTWLAVQAGTALLVNHLLLTSW
ncbi:hypothetical protein COUCH_36255 [Couchioplanes caeruleus]|uniref:hypothetical protein n=1 Tax=Couchioplanes caeruleus TaxID=56438 RepID=UPI0020BE04A3|nr:hypothetical protein [Couchioplanes caeruleus]UQU64352.1 hypothetical protein COUCH_36255 [Couchioplanes caeruleus]